MVSVTRPWPTSPITRSRKSIAVYKLRDGMARALARKFDAAQIGEINAFLATPTGRIYGREMVGLWFEPEMVNADSDVATFRAKRSCRCRTSTRSTRCLSCSRPQASAR